MALLDAVFTVTVSTVLRASGAESLPQGGHPAGLRVTAKLMLQWNSVSGELFHVELAC